MNTSIKLLFAFCIILLIGKSLPAQVKSSGTGSNVQLKVLSYNLRFGELASLEELAAFIKSMDPDIVALQEVDYMTHRPAAPHQNGKDFITELGYRTGMLTAYAKTIPYSGGYYGVGILSKYPFISTRKVMLPMPNGAKEQRALLIADVELNNGNIFTFVTAHLDYPNSEVRQAQVSDLNETLLKNPFPVILAGDFNAKPSSVEIREGMSQWLQACNPDFTIPSKTPEAKIDYIFCYPKKAFQVLQSTTPKVQLSDHLPVSAVINLKY